MLRDSFYRLDSVDRTPGELKAVIAIQKHHPIFAGHFPGHPIVPGVCMIQIVKEFLEEETQCKLRLTEADNIKFLAPIDPRVNGSVNVSVTYHKTDDVVTVTASLFHGSLTFFKLKARLKANP